MYLMRTEINQPMDPSPCNNCRHCLSRFLLLSVWRWPQRRSNTSELEEFGFYELQGVEILFNLVFSDYDIDPALVSVGFADGRTQTLQTSNQGTLNGLTLARTAIFAFNELLRKMQTMANMALSALPSSRPRTQPC